RACTRAPRHENAHLHPPVRPQSEAAAVPESTRGPSFQKSGAKEAPCDAVPKNVNVTRSPNNFHDWHTGCTHFRQDSPKNTEEYRMNALKLLRRDHSAVRSLFS